MLGMHLPSGVEVGASSKQPKVPALPGRVSYELQEEDVQQIRRSLERTQQLINSLSVKKEENQQTAKLHESQEQQYASFVARHPNALTELKRFQDLCKDKRVVVFLDYDGTLTPIVANPDRAFMSQQMRQVVRDVARLFPAAIISGRGREKVETFVKLNELFYAGSHGMDIAGPRTDGNGKMEFRAAAEFEEVINSVYDKLTARVHVIDGAAVEHNKFCVSVHFRNVDPSLWHLVAQAVERTLEEFPTLRVSRGRKVLEVRPLINWDKGRALLHLLDALGLADQPDVLPIYLGDDKTDEDAFRALNSHTQGVGILVSSKAKPSVATFSLRDPVEVLKFLQKLANWGRELHNGWHYNQTCVGWQPATALHTIVCEEGQQQAQPSQQRAGQGVEMEGTGHGRMLQAPC